MAAILGHCLTWTCGTLQVWQVIAEKTRPLLRAIPLLNYPVNFVKSWFNVKLVPPPKPRL